jgi:hypothetical protein
MRQKYIISLEGVKDELKIREYAIIEKALKKAASSLLGNESFSFLGEEKYEGSIISSSILKGIDALIAALRTRNLYPVGPLAIKIAESVMALYNSKEERSVELFFDDVEVFEKNLLPAGG